MNRQSVHTTCIPIYHLRSGTLFQFILSHFDPVLPLTRSAYSRITHGCPPFLTYFTGIPSWHKNKKCWKSYDSSTSLHLSFSFVTPGRFTRNGVNYVVCQDFRLLENHGCSLFAHPDISMFFVYLQRKSSYNSLISGRFQC